MTAFDVAVDSLFNDPNLAVDALLRLGGTGAAQAIRVIRSMPDRFSSFREGRFVVDSAVINIRLSDAPVLSVGDTIAIAGDIYVLRAEPTRDGNRLIWTAEMQLQ